MSSLEACPVVVKQLASPQDVHFQNAETNYQDVVASYVESCYPGVPAEQVLVPTFGFPTANQTRSLNGDWRTDETMIEHEMED